MSATKAATVAKCDKPATAIVKLGKGPEVPACEPHIEGARARSAKAGKKTLPKTLTKAQAAQITGANGDDVLPVNVRGFTEAERESELRCLNHLIAKGEADDATV